MSDVTPTEKPVSLWRNRDYLLLWLGQAASSLGTGISQFAFPLLILTLTHSFAVAGFVGALGELPFLLFVLPAGAVVDRWDRKRIMILCSVGLALCLTSIAVVLPTGYLTVAQIYIVSFLMGTFAVFYQIAQLAALSRVVPQQQLPTAAAQDEAVYSTVSLLAPSLGGLLLSVGYVFPFVADAISYLVLSTSLLTIRASFQGERPDGPRHLFAEVWEGIGWLWSNSVIRSLAFLTGYLYVVMAGNTLIVYSIARHHQISSFFIGVILAAGGVGNLLGTALATPIQRRANFGRALLSILVLFVLLWPLYDLANSIIFLGGVVVVIALLDSISTILITSYRLAVIPNELQGRVGSVYRLIIYGSLTIGQAFIGQCIDHFGENTTIGVFWCGLLLFAMMMFVQPKLRQASYPKASIS